jgi:hypothetical protein
MRSDFEDYGFWNLTPEFKTFSLPEVEVVAPQAADSSDEGTEQKGPAPKGSTNDKDYKIPYYIPPYKKGKWTDWAHLLAIHGNNTIGHLKDYNLASQI